MNCFVTGASGFIGANLVHELAARGHRVKALVRQDADRRGLRGIDCETVYGDLLDPASLKTALRGCDWCFHLGASYHLWLKDYAPMHATNVEGTRNVLEAAAAAGCARVVHTSTTGCLPVPANHNGATRPVDESAFAPESLMGIPYKRSKWRAEQLALDWAAKGLPVVVVNPSAPVGPRDVRPTPTGRIILDFLKGRMPAYMDTGLNFVHVRDVAVGHILAAERGRIGERYILGSAQGNWTLRQAFLALEELTGQKAPSLRLPYWVALTAAQLGEWASAVSGRPPRAPIAGVVMARQRMFYDPGKAIRELGLPQTPPRQAFADAAAWFQEQGYLGNGTNGRGSAW